MKKYLIRVYIFNPHIGNLVNMCIDSGAFKLTKSNEGKEGLLCIYEGYATTKCLMFLIGIGVTYFPLNNYEDFVITCPNCGERIDDEMILLTYDDNYFMGYNINCNRKDCGCQMANVDFLK